MSEGRVYVCTWIEGPRGIRVSVRGNPRISGIYDNWAAVHEKFWKVIMCHTGDGEPVLTFDPPLPPPEDDCEYLKADLALLRGAAYSGSKTPPGELFSGGRCPHCGWARGSRNDRFAHFYSLEAPVCHSPQEWWFAVSGLYVSKRFLTLLTDGESRCIDTRRLERPPGSRHEYYEIVPRSFVPFVAHIDRPVSGGWRCPACDRQMFSQHVNDRLLSDFIAEADLPRPIPPIFAVGDPVAFKLCTPAARAAALIRQRDARGLDMCRVGVLPESLVERRPAVKPHPSVETLRQQTQDMVAAARARLEQRNAQRKLESEPPHSSGEP